MMRYHGSTAGLDRTLMAIAEPTRRRILERVARGEARVTDIAAAFPISLNSISKHLRLLERARLLERRVAGREHLFRFRPEPLQAAQAWIAAQQQFWAGRLQAMDDLLGEDESSEMSEVPRPKAGSGRGSGPGLGSGSGSGSGAGAGVGSDAGTAPAKRRRRSMRGVPRAAVGVSALGAPDKPTAGAARAARDERGKQDKQDKREKRDKRGKRHTRDEHDTRVRRDKER